MSTVELHVDHCKINSLLQTWLVARLQLLDLTSLEELIGDLLDEFSLQHFQAQS